MIKITKIVSTVFIAILLFGCYKVASLAMTDSTDYSRADWLAYKIIAPTEVKNAPFLTDDTVIHFRAADGASPQIDEIEYGKNVDEAVLGDYLESLGYRQVDDPVFGKRWAQESSGRSAYIAKTEDAIKLTFTN